MEFSTHGCDFLARFCKSFVGKNSFKHGVFSVVNFALCIVVANNGSFCCTFLHVQQNVKNWQQFATKQLTYFVYKTIFIA